MSEIKRVVSKTNSGYLEVTSVREFNSKNIITSNQDEFTGIIAVLRIQGS